MSNIKHCINCKHFRKDYKFGGLWVPIIGWFIFFLDFITKRHILYGKCAIAFSNNNSRVFSKFKDGLYYASRERNYGNCGPEGNKYEQK